MAKKKFYAVRVGRKVGVFTTWAECEAQVKGFKGAEYKSFPTEPEAQAYIGGVAPANKKVSPIVSKHLDVYVDGSYKDGRYSWSFVVYNNDTLIHKDAGVGTNTQAAAMNNVAGELAASMRAAKWAAANKKRIIIHHDYQGISSWVDGSWKAKNEMTKAYKAFMAKYRDIVSFNKVAGHTGIEGNELADQLAKEALGI